jgi:phosphoglycolate phosphatase-like HAD superfamily hydrolase
MTKPLAEIFDVDGTLCDVTEVRHHVLGRPKNFDAFHEGAAACPPHPHVAEAARTALQEGRAVLVVTARKEMWRRLTGFWLAMHDIPSTMLYMREDKDGRPDYEVKKDILRRIRSRFEVIKAWDDNPSVITLWESEGIPTEIVPGWVYDKEDQ